MSSQDNIGHLLGNFAGGMGVYGQLELETFGKYLDPISGQVKTPK